LKSKKENVDYNRLIKQGVCFACGNEVIGYGFLEEFILTLEEKYGVEIVQIGYDRMNAISTVQKLEAAGYECAEIKQHSSVLHPATKLLKESVLNRTFRYDENLMLEINFQNARCTEDTNLNKYVNKKKSSGKVDEVAALINSVYLLQQELLYGSDELFIQVF
jgi:phage terminase large subunit-like protein